MRKQVQWDEVDPPMDLSAKPRPLDIVAKVPQNDTCVCGTTRVFVIPFLHCQGQNKHALIPE